MSLLKAINKAKAKKNTNEAAFDPKKPKGVRIYVATKFPDWQDTSVQVIQDAYSEERDKDDDAKVKNLLPKKALIKDKHDVPFIQLFKVRLFSFLFCSQDRFLTTCGRFQRRMAQYGTSTAFRHALPFSECRSA